MSRSAPAEGRRRTEAGELNVIRTREGLDSIREAWLSLRPQRITADPDYFRAALDGDPKIVRPHVVVLERAGEPEAMAVARVEHLDLPYRIGYRTVYKPRVRSLTVVVGGILGNLEEDMFELLLEQLRSDVRAEGADFLLFRYLDTESQLYRWASEKPPLAERQHVVQSGIRWELELPGSFDSFLRTKSSRSRRAFNSQRRRLQRDFGDSFRIRIFEEPADLDEFLAAVERVASRTYQRALGVGFGATKSHRERTRLAMERGWFRGYVLYLDGAPAAFAHGEVYAGSFRSGTPGFDPAHASYSVGSVLRLSMIEDLCADDRVETVDFGLGDAEFKRRLSTRGWKEANVFVFAPTLRGKRLNLIHSVVIRSSQLIHDLGQRAGILAGIKRRWRARIADDRRPE